jgi:hypothetical protein
MQHSAGREPASKSSPCSARDHPCGRFPAWPTFRFDTVAKLLVDAGKACAAFHDERVRGVKARRVQVDEIWSFTAAKQKNVPHMKRQVEGARAIPGPGPQIEPDTKLLITWLGGGRDGDYAIAFMDDLRDRLANRVQLTSDGHRAYLEAVEGAFGADVDYAQLVKLFGAAPESLKGRYSPGECIGIRKERIEGDPDPRHVSTSYAERQNLTMRMQMRRFTRLTDAFSKKFENHMHMVALYGLVQLHEAAKEPKGAFACNGRRSERHALVNERSGRNGRCALAQAR